APSTSSSRRVTPNDDASSRSDPGHATSRLTLEFCPVDIGAAVTTRRPQISVLSCVPVRTPTPIPSCAHEQYPASPPNDRSFRCCIQLESSAHQPSPRAPRSPQPPSPAAPPTQRSPAPAAKTAATSSTLL